VERKGANLEPAVPAALGVLGDPKRAAGHREQAVRILAALAPERPAVIQALTDALKDDSAGVRREAIDALAREQRPSLEVIDVLASKLKDPAVEIGCQAAAVLGRLGDRARSAVPELLEAVRHKHSLPLRRSALSALVRIGAERVSALPVFSEILREPKEDEALRVLAVAGLLKVDPNLERALPILGEVLIQRGTPRRLLEALGEALVNNGRERAVHVLDWAVRHGNHDAALQAIRSLEKLGPLARAARPALEEAAREDDPAIRGAAQRALQRIPPM
jgi:HEAT repeat protein